MIGLLAKEVRSKGRERFWQTEEIPTWSATVLFDMFTFLFLLSKEAVICLWSEKVSSQYRVNKEVFPISGSPSNITLQKKSWPPPFSMRALSV